MRRRLVSLLVLVCWPAMAWAHVGSKDVFEQVQAGPYTLFVTVRMPNVIPGVAEVEVRASGSAVQGIQITPMPLTGEASKHPPTADAMRRSSGDPAFFTGGVWMMAPGSWQVRLEASGERGIGRAAVPVPAVALSTLPMQPGLGWLLVGLGLFLVVTMAGVVAASVSEARLPAGASTTPTLRRRGLVAMGSSLAVMALLLYGGAAWWKADAAGFARGLYRPLRVRALLNGNRLDLQVAGQVAQSPMQSQFGSGLGSRANNDFLPDHGKLIHLYAIRQPEMDAVFHLHPEFDGKGDFRMALPTMPPGQYRLYGDVVHANGFPETLVTEVTVPAGMAGGALAADDAEALPVPVSQGQSAASYRLPDGYSIVWDRQASLVADAASTFRFRLLRPDGIAATDVQPYLGMAGHAAFVKTDGTVFAHTHPEGSAPMASLMLANGDSMRALEMGAGPMSNTVSFPYGFPSAGRYRILVQMKHSGVVETGVFDAMVAQAPAR